MAVGLRQDDTRRLLNLTQLFRNKRKKTDRTCGRKRLRADDVDVVPAGDAHSDVAETLVEAINNVNCTICVTFADINSCIIEMTFMSGI